MKLIRKITGAALALTMAMSLTLTAFAATYDVTTSAEIIEAVDGHNSNADGDRTVILNMKNDITMESPIQTVKDWTYTIKGNGHTLKNVTVAGAGTTDIQADISNAGDSNALTVKNEAVVTVTGDISAEEGPNSSCAVRGMNQSAVTVTGDITAAGEDSSGVVASGESDVTVTGNVSAEGDHANAVTAWDDSAVTVTGNVSAEGDGANAVSAKFDSTVNITGDVTGTGAESRGVRIDDEASVTVNGDVSGLKYGADVSGSLDLTIHGNLTSDNIGIVFYPRGDAQTNVTVNGDVYGKSSGFIVDAGSDSCTTVQITGDISTQGTNRLYLTDEADLNVTVTGNSENCEPEGGRGLPVWWMEIDGWDNHVKLTHKGNISSAHGHAIFIDSRSESGNATLDLEGTVSGDDPERAGIRVSGSYEDFSVDIRLDGKLNGVVSNSMGDSPLNIEYRELVQSMVSVPEKILPSVFTAEDLEGKAVSSEDDMVLIYFDPAAPESPEALRKGQETASQGETVFAVCLTEDYAGARALMEKAGAEYPVLKCSDSLRQILTAYGGGAPVTIVVRDGEFRTPERNYITTHYVEKDPKILQD